MSHSHALDFDVVLAALRARRFGYVGLIGSASKKARFISRMRQAGLGDGDIGRLVCPIGIDGIESKQPAVIAASVVADLLRRRDSMALADAERGGLVLATQGSGTNEHFHHGFGQRQPDGGGRVHSGGAQHRQAVRRLAGQRRYRPEPEARRDPRAAGRERCRQVHPGEDHLRRPAADIGGASLAGNSGDDFESGRSAGSRHRHGVPALLAIRCTDRHTEHRPCAQGGKGPEGACRADRDDLRRLRPAAAAWRAGGGPLGGRAPAHRGGALPPAGAAPADPGRAHRGPDAAGGGPALRHAGAPGRRGLRGALHLPPAGRGEAPLPRRDDPAPGAAGGAGRSAAGIRRVPRQAHDRHRCRGA